MNIFIRIINNCVKYGPNYDLQKTLEFYDDIQKLQEEDYERLFYFLKAKIDKKISEVYL